MVLSNHEFFQYCDSKIELFSIAPCKVITLNPLCILFGISSLLFLMALSPKLSLFQLTRQQQLVLFLALKGDRLQLLFANAFKIVKERKLLLSQQLEAIQKEATNQSTNLIQNFKQRAITKCGAKEKSPILLSQYWIKDHL